LWSAPEPAIMTARHARAEMEDLCATHPCYTEDASLRYGRVHLAVASRCNLGCNYCERYLGAAAFLVGGPGSAEQMLSPTEALERVTEIKARGWLRVVGIAGPGEPLANPETLKTLRLVADAHPDLLLCLSTNGLLLSERLDDLVQIGVRAVTVTVNTVRAETAYALYDWARIEGRLLTGHKPAEDVLSRQWDGLARAAQAGLLVKVNSVLVPGINDDDLANVAKRAAGLRVARHNIMPLIPRGRMRERRAPTSGELEAVRSQCERWLVQFRGCQQCRADVIAPPRGAQREPAWQILEDAHITKKTAARAGR